MSKVNIKIDFPDHKLEALLLEGLNSGQPTQLTKSEIEKVRRIIEMRTAKSGNTGPHCLQKTDSVFDKYS